MIYQAFNLGDNLLWVFGGLALFLFGINLMSDSLRQAAGSKLRLIIDKATSTPLKGIFVGIILTILIQSSSATTALMIGLLRAGLMTLPQSVGVIIGANIGTSATAFIIALPIAKYGFIFVAVGVIFSFIKKGSIRHYGGVLLGLGLLFVGLNTMSDGIRPLAETDAAQNMFHVFSTNWFYGTVFGTIFTAIVQSSSSAIGVLQKLYALNAEGINSISLNGAIPILLGSGIGTTITAFLASLGGNIESKRASFIHFFFNILTAIFFITILVPYTKFVAWVEKTFFSPYSMLTLAVAHLLQKTTITIIIFPFIKPIIKLSQRVVPGKSNGVIPEDMFDEKLIDESPTMALALVRKGVLSMGNTIKEYMDVAHVYSLSEQPELVKEAFTFEMILDSYDQKLHDYLIKIAQRGLSARDSRRLSRNLDSIKDFERIGDHLTNIIQFFNQRYKNYHELSEAGKNELDQLYSILKTMLNDTVTSYENNDIELAKKVVQTEDVVDALEERFRYQYMERLKNGEITVNTAENYPDILANLERIGDHLTNIAGAIIEPMYVPQLKYVPKPRELDNNKK